MCSMSCSPKRRIMPTRRLIERSSQIGIIGCIHLERVFIKPPKQSSSWGTSRRFGFGISVDGRSRLLFRLISASKCLKVVFMFFFVEPHLQERDGLGYCGEILSYNLTIVPPLSTTRYSFPLHEQHVAEQHSICTDT